MPKPQVKTFKNGAKAIRQPNGMYKIISGPTKKGVKRGGAVQDPELQRKHMENMKKKYGEQQLEEMLRSGFTF